MRLLTLGLTTLLLGVVSAVPLAQSPSKDEYKDGVPGRELFQRLGTVCKEGAAYLAGTDWLPRKQSDWKASKAHHKPSLKKRTKVEQDPELEALHQKYNTYRRKFRGPKNKAKREALEAGLGSRQELDEYLDLKRGFDAWDKILRQRYKKEPPKFHDPATYTPEEVEKLHELFKLYSREYATKKYKGRLAALREGRATPEEIQRWLEAKAGKENYVRWKRWKAKQIRPEFTPEELKILETNRLGYRKFARLYFGRKADKAKRARLEAGKGTTEEIREFQELREQHRKYVRVATRGLSTISTPFIEVDEELLDLALELEELREKHNAYYRIYAGKDKRELRKNLKQGIGPPVQVREFEELSKASLAFKKKYKLLRKQIREEELESGQLVTERSGRIQLPRENGHPRWGRPFVRTIEKVKELSRKKDVGSHKDGEQSNQSTASPRGDDGSESNETNHLRTEDASQFDQIRSPSPKEVGNPSDQINKAVLEPKQPTTSSPGVRDLQGSTKDQQSFRGLRFPILSGASQKLKEAIDVTKTGIATSLDKLEHGIRYAVRNKAPPCSNPLSCGAGWPIMKAPPLTP